VTPVAVLFDLDGVLADSRAAITSCLNHALAAVGAPTRDPAELARFIGPPLLEVFTELTDATRAPEAILAYRDRYRTASLEHTTAYPGAVETLACIAAATPTALATSKPLAFAQPLCDRLGLAPHLDVIEGPSLDVPAESKAETVARALSALKLNAGADAVLVGDRRHDVEGAHANGIRCIAALWGFGDRAELEAAGADAFAATLSELPATL
jgi:phosphoglycolate phosphatase